MQIRPKWYPLETIQKLQARSLGPFKVLKQLDLMHMP